MRVFKPNIRHLQQKRAAGLALGKLGNSEAVKALLSTLHDPDGGVRGYAVAALGEIGDGRAVRSGEFR